MPYIQTVAAPLRHEIDKIKGSRFLTAVHPVRDLDEIDAFLSDCRETYRDANHNCFAWRLAGADRMRYSDDGEPSGTAGRPILQEIDGRDLVDVAVVVTRYFGGTRLGTGGLVRAYGGAAAAALDLAEIVRHRLVETVGLTFDYTLTGPVQGILSAYDLMPTASDYGADVRLELSVPIEQVDEVRRALLDGTHGKARLDGSDDD